MDGLRAPTGAVGGATPSVPITRPIHALGCHWLSSLAREASPHESELGRERHDHQAEPDNAKQNDLETSHDPDRKSSRAIDQGRESCDEERRECKEQGCEQRRPVPKCLPSRLDGLTSSLTCDPREPESRYEERTKHKRCRHSRPRRAHR